MAVAAVIAVTMSLGAAAEPPAAVRCRELCFEFVDGTVVTGQIGAKVITIQIASGNVLKVPVADLTELTVGLKEQRGSVEQAKPQCKIRAGESTLVGILAVKKFRIASPYGPVTMKLDAVHRIFPAVKATPGKLGQWTIELRDKTRFRGMLVNKTLRIQTRYGTMVVPLAQIWKVTFAADGKTIRVQCRGSDRIVGTLGPKTTISFKTDKGRADIPAEKIAMVAVVYNRPLTLALGKGVTMKLVLIPAGKFLMGSPKTEKYRNKNEGPQRQVTISREFYMGLYEVTQAQWRAVMGTEPWDGKTYAKSGDNNAASYISWDDAIKFCEKLSKHIGTGRTHVLKSDDRLWTLAETYYGHGKHWQLLAAANPKLIPTAMVVGRTIKIPPLSSQKVVLPTEAQWEYACRAGSNTAYSFGDDASKLGDYASYYDKTYGKALDKDAKYPHPVGMKKPNAWGLYDMHGNMGEWCSNWFADSYPNADVRDPKGPDSGKDRILRGGSWYYKAEYCRAASRFMLPPASLYDYFGFRVVVESGPGAD